MTASRHEEKRYLTNEENDLVARTHHPAIGGLADADLQQLIKLVRERRDRAQDIARSQRREIRGKGRPRGATPVAEDAGARMKSAILAQAVKRLNSETDRRRRATRRDELVAASRRALELKRSAATPQAPASRNAAEGMKNKPSVKRKKTVPGAKIGSVSKAGKKAQAKRDS